MHWSDAADALAERQENDPTEPYGDWALPPERSTMKTPITEAAFERMADRAVWQRLENDPAYRNAENAEQQAEAEERIETEVVAELESRYTVEG